MEYLIHHKRYLEILYKSTYSPGRYRTVLSNLRPAKDNKKYKNY